MDDKRIEELWKQTAVDNMPDLWQRIEKELPPRASFIEREGVEEETRPGEKHFQEIYSEKENAQEEKNSQGISKTLSGKKKIVSGNVWNRWGKWAAAAACLLLVLGPVRGKLTRIGGETRMESTGQDGSAAASFQKNSGVFTGQVYSAGTADYGETYEDTVDSQMLYSDSVAEETPMMAQTEMADEESNSSASSTQSAVNDSSQTDRKMIKTIDMSVETLDFEQFAADLEKAVNQAGGYFESSRVNGRSYQSGNDLRYGYYTIRVPEKDMETFSKELEGFGNILYQNERVEDVTLQYSDTEGHIKALQTQRDRLLELMEKAETMEDIITIEARLSEVQYELESYQSSKKLLDNQISYVTIQLEVSEVQKATPPVNLSLWERIRLGLENSVADVLAGTVDFLVGVVICLPYFLVLGVIAAVVVLVIRKIRKRK